MVVRVDDRQVGFDCRLRRLSSHSGRTVRCELIEDGVDGISSFKTGSSAAAIRTSS